MKILLTGGGTGGHFYPLIAVAEKINTLIDQQKIVDAKLYYMSDTPYDKATLFENGITFIEVSAGKNRLYKSSKNFTDMFKVALGCLSGLVQLFVLYPDVVFSKGGYASVPALFAARILGIPVIIHDSDSVPGRVSLWSAKFAHRIAISYPEAIEYFTQKDKVALTGQPIREEIGHRAKDGVFEYFTFDPTIPTVFIVGGSQGAQNINNILVDILPELLKKYQVIHQVGSLLMTENTERISVVLDKHPFAERYKPYPTLNPLMLKMAAGASSLIVSRAGSMIFEIANWGVPSIIIPIPLDVSHDQKHNAYNYARSGACTVIEEGNLTPSILYAEIDKLLSDKNRLEAMSKQALGFAKPDAALQIATELVKIAVSHEN